MRNHFFQYPTHNIFGTPLPKRCFVLVADGEMLLNGDPRLCGDDKEGRYQVERNEKAPLSKGAVAKKFERKNFKSLFQKSLALKDIFFGNTRDNGNFFFRIIPRKHGVNHFETSLYFSSCQAAVNFFLTDCF